MRIVAASSAGLSIIEQQEKTAENKEKFVKTFVMAQNNWLFMIIIKCLFAVSFRL